jgi:DNA replication protein DnaC
MAMTDEIAQLLTSLRLTKVAELLDAELSRADKDGLSHQELLARLLRAQWHHQQESALAWRIKQACMPEAWTLESFPFKHQAGVSQRQIRGFAELDFVPKAENIVFVGPTGVGKTGLAMGLLLKALQNGYRGLFMRAQDLFDEMYASLADRSSRKLLNRLSRVDVLVIDEMGYLNLRPEQTNIFFKLMEERYRRRPTIITINRAQYSKSHGGFDPHPADRRRRGIAGAGTLAAHTVRRSLARAGRSRTNGAPCPRRGPRRIICGRS